MTEDELRRLYVEEGVSCPKIAARVGVTGETVRVWLRFYGIPTRPKNGWRKPAEQRFWPKVDRRGPKECWPWRARVNAWGYGTFKFTPGENNRLAHRVAYELAVGPIPVGLLVMHSCDNPPCCNPEHLSVGTNADNTADMIAKGRRRPDRRG